MNWRLPMLQFKQRPAFYAGVLFFIVAVLTLVWAGLKVNDYLHSQQTAPVRQVRLYGDFHHIDATVLHQTLQHILRERRKHRIGTAQCHCTGIIGATEC